VYEQYWGLAEPPFSLTPDPKFLYMSPKHEDCLTLLLHAITRNKGAVMLTGEVGHGKTTLSRKLLQELDEAEYKILMIVNPILTPIQLLREILEQLGATDLPRNRQILIKMLHEKLLEHHQKGQKVVLVVDEAHLIRDKQTFEELRLLLNFQLNDRFLISLVLIGQPELEQKVAKIPALKQRLAIRAHLPPLSLLETGEMLRHRLAAAWHPGNGRGVFSPEAVHEIYQYTNGCPRIICQVADNALLVGMVRRAKVIDGYLMHSVIMEFEGREW
jgi:general secretion pathway protein A